MFISFSYYFEHILFFCYLIFFCVLHFVFCIEILRILIKLNIKPSGPILDEVSFILRANGRGDLLTELLNDLLNQR